MSQITRPTKDNGENEAYAVFDRYIKLPFPTIFAFWAHH